MQEFNNDTLDNSQASVKKEPLSARLDNFWYHYKWHSLIALFLIFAITVCTLQMCNKESYDVHVLYSGEYEIERRSSDGNIPEYQMFLSSIGRVTKDYDGDGESRVTLKDLFMLSKDEIKQVEASKEYEVNYALINENKQILSDTIMYSEYYVCLLSPDVYEQYKVIDGVEIFAPLSPFVEEGIIVEYYTDSAVLLSSTGFSKLPGISSLPSDTLICLKNPSVFASHFNEKETAKNYERGSETIKNILNYK